MLKRLFGCVREYKRISILTLVLMVLEAAIETMIPFITANLVNSIKDGTELTEVIRTGLILAALAIASLACGGIAGFTSANASAGFAKNMRLDLFSKIHTYSFENFCVFLPTPQDDDTLNYHVAAKPKYTLTENTQMRMESALPLPMVSFLLV